MKSGVFVLNHDTGFRNMKKDLVIRYGKAETDRIWEKAGKNCGYRIYPRPRGR